MHSPPSVSYPVGRSPAADCLVAAVWTTGAVWAGLSAIGPMAESMAAWRALVACAIVPMAGLAVWRSRQRAIHGTLLFDAGRWALSRGAGAVMTLGRTRTCIDLQRFLLIHVEVAGRRQGHWLWADRDADPEHWRDLRRALHAKSDTSESVTFRQGERAIST